MMRSSGDNETIRDAHPIKGAPTQPPTALSGLRAAGSLRRPLTGKADGGSGETTSPAQPGGERGLEVSAELYQLSYSHHRFGVTDRA